MEIALISDIHSNIYALQSVLEDTKKREIKHIYCLGDIVGYHSFPNEVIDLMKENKIESIKGNHDKDISELEDDESLESIKGWTRQQLTTENLEYLQFLPEEMELEVEGCRVLLVHGSPSSITEYMYENEENSKAHLEALDGDVLVSAHTHLPYVYKAKNKMMINSGSVGKPKIGKPLASYVTLKVQHENQLCEADIRYVSYPYEKASDDMLKKGLSKKHATELLTGSVLA